MSRRALFIIAVHLLTVDSKMIDQTDSPFKSVEHTSPFQIVESSPRTSHRRGASVDLRRVRTALPRDRSTTYLTPVRNGLRGMR